MGVSPKTYYVWERRYLDTLNRGFQERLSGRPETVVDPVKEQMAARITALQQQVAELTAELKATRLYAEFHKERHTADSSVSPEEKKGVLRRSLVGLVTETKEQAGVPYRRSCAVASLPYRSIMRWKGRLERGVPVVERTGPKKVERPDMGKLFAINDGYGYCRPQPGVNVERIWQSARDTNDVLRSGNEILANPVVDHDILCSGTCIELLPVAWRCGAERILSVCV